MGTECCISTTIADPQRSRPRRRSRRRLDKRWTDK